MFFPYFIITFLRIFLFFGVYSSLTNVNSGFVETRLAILSVEKILYNSTDYYSIFLRIISGISFAIR